MDGITDETSIEFFLSGFGVESRNWNSKIWSRNLTFIEKSEHESCSEKLSVTSIGFLDKYRRIFPDFVSKKCVSWILDLTNV